MVSSQLDNTPGRVKFMCLMPVELLDDEGCIFTLTFHAAEGIEGGTQIPLTLEIVDFYLAPMESGDQIDIPYEMVDGTVTVSYMPGDVNRDGEFDTMDVILVLRYSLDIVEFDDEQIALGDINGDGVVNASDAIVMLRMILDLI